MTGGTAPLRTGGTAPRPACGTALRPACGTALRRGSGGTQRRGICLAAGLALQLTLAACGSPGTATSPAPATPGGSSAGAYLSCLLQHRGGGPGSARQACASVRPADLAAELLTFGNCLTAHGVTVPSLPAQGRRAALLRFLATLRTGSAAQRSALASCSPSRVRG
jgi:hypothetical protein